MKQQLLLLLILPLVSFSQSISVSTTSHTVPQLINNVLINSPCASATNVTWRTGTNFSSSNGIGYFENTNPAFPMQNGVILSTGNVLNAVGPNNSLLSDGTETWPGDSSLELTLAAAGINMSSKNGTVLEFDFTPISSKFDFNFIFAAEAYGISQCEFSDAFAFLLTNVTTGVTTNLAVVPGNNQPISVVTIRDAAYNSSCASVNPQYFGSYNVGANANVSATNFNGQTVPMNASTTLTPNTPYHLKLVIADRDNSQSDSAVFIGGNSMNIGQNVLGPDLTIATNTAACIGQAYTLETGLNPSAYTFTWKKNSVLIVGATGPTLQITEGGTYEVTYSSNAFNCEVTDNIVVEFKNCSLGIDNTSERQKICFYPNPTTGELIVKYQTFENTETRFIVTNNLGQVVFSNSKFETAGAHSKSLSLTAQPEGIYFVRIISGKNTTTNKIIKQ